MRLIVCSLTSALALGLSTVAIAAETKPKPAAGATAKEEKAKDPDRKLPMRARVDSIDAKGKTFTQKRKDGVEVKHIITATTEIRNGDGPGKFEEIKVGDQVNGSRVKKSETEYEIVKITKYGPPEPRKGKDEKKP